MLINVRAEKNTLLLTKDRTLFLEFKKLGHSTVNSDCLR